MARRGKEIQLQKEVETQDEWEEMLTTEGLCVIDLYQQWSGPCKGLLMSLKRIKIELSDPLLRFAIAKCDTVDALEKYRGRCQPCFLFFAGGVLVAVVREANAPLILRTITEQLAQEHKVLDGQGERKEIKDPLICQMEAKERQEQEKEAAEKEEEEGRKEVSVVIIKPDAVESGKAEEIIEEMTTRGIEILQQEERQLTEDEVKEIYSHLAGEAYFDDIVKWMSSSPCIVLAITKGKTGENIIKEFRELIGPTEVEEAKAQAPDSLRAKYGSNKYMNAVHGSDSADTAARELAFFFPGFVSPGVEGRVKVQRTLALVRPDAYKLHKDDILANIRESGFKVAMQKEIHLTKEQAEDFYKEHQGQDYFEELTQRMSNGPLLALGLAREDAVTGWRQMIGPTKIEEAKETAPDSLRAKYAVDDTPINMIHGSNSEETAKKELQYFFPIEQTIAVIKPDAYQTKDEIIEKIHDSGFRIAARKETTLSRDIAEEFYGDHKDKSYYNDLVEHMVSGPTLFMVLSREDAVEGWRSMIGPTDPSKAKEIDPETIRGQFGSDTLKNAVHGSSNIDHAKTSISRIFGDLHFNEDGTLKGYTKGKAKAAEQPLAKSEAEKVSVEQPQSENEAKSENEAQNETEAPGISEAQDKIVADEATSGSKTNAADEQDPDAIAEQQQISYEPAPEYRKEEEESQDRTSPPPEPEAQQEEEQQQQEEQKDEEHAKAKSPEPEKTMSPEPEKTKSPEPEKAKSPEPEKAKSPEPEKAKSPEPEKAKSPEPEKAKSPEPEKAKSPEPEKTKTPEPEKTGEGEQSEQQQQQEEVAKEPEQQQQETEKAGSEKGEDEKTDEGKQEETKETTEKKDETSEEKKDDATEGGGQ